MQIGREMGPRLFQRNLGWWDIIIWPGILYGTWLCDGLWLKSDSTHSGSLIDGYMEYY